MKPLAPVSIYLDDQRVNPYPGWLAVRSAEEALGVLLTREVQHASLDHDLGACDDCTSVRREADQIHDRIQTAKRLLDATNITEVTRVDELRAEHARLTERLIEIESRSYYIQSCPHAATGFDLVEWMHAFHAWPTKSIQVHSANPEGALQMRVAIQRHWPGPRAFVNPLDERVRALGFVTSLERPARKP